MTQPATATSATRRNWRAIWQGVIAFMTLLTAGTTLADVIGARVAGLLTLLIAALQAGLAAYWGAVPQPVMIHPSSSPDSPTVR